MLPAMDWSGKPHPLEKLADWGAPSVLAAAAGWAASAAGLPLAAIAAASVISLATGIIAMRLAGGSPIANEAGFEPVPLNGGAAYDELLLDEPLGENELVLDDPLVVVPADSRVVRLFARQDPTPGELVTRISDFLSDNGKAASAEIQAIQQPHPDASAALQSALANIRASLR